MDYLFLLKIITALSILMVIYALFSGRVWGRSWQKYMGGWIYKKEDRRIFWSYVFMYFAIAFFSSICSLLF